MKFTSILRKSIRQKAFHKPFGLIGAFALSIDFLSAKPRRQVPPSIRLEHKQIIDEAVKSLRDVGFFAIPDFFDIKQTKKLAEKLQSTIDQHPEFIHPSTPYDKRIHGIENLEDEFQLFANNPLLHDIANVYLEEPASLAFTLGGILESSADNPGSGGGWHRDNFTRQFKTMVYLSDVEALDGPFQIIEKSHHFAQSIKDNFLLKQPYNDSRFSNDQINYLLEVRNQKILHTLTAKAGTVLLFDSSAIHRGMPIKSGKRLALTNYFYPTLQINSELYRHFKPVVGHMI